MTLPSVFDVVTVLVILGATVHAISLFIGPGWARFECPECDLTIRFRGVSDPEAEFLRLQMQNHIAGHETEGAGQ
ncbi:hypothetical protein [Streptomyces sp. H27-H5]|uniref:hypothetical protein n=1 Tax=Streptomyces sp. H27-H5 TaxID=2996460 RepID=UPI002270791C|nr:hypothetical protein [Streptomyces sp. H27-H5]MCY0962789.1 hypothetical protein [Streptomyces sp. H27-H5]